MKLFKRTRLSKKDLRQLIINFSKTLGVKKIYFSDRAKHVNGTYQPYNQTIYLDTKLNNLEMMHTFFHELGHHHAVLNKKWTKYHFGNNGTLKPEAVFDIENQIDQIGNKLWNKYVDTKQWGKYNYAYPKAQKNLMIKLFINRQK